MNNTNQHNRHNRHEPGYRHISRSSSSSNHSYHDGSPNFGSSSPASEGYIRSQYHGNGSAGSMNYSPRPRTPEQRAFTIIRVPYPLPSPRALFPDQFINTPRQELPSSYRPLPYYQPPVTPREGSIIPSLYEMLNSPGYLTSSGYRSIAPRPSRDPPRTLLPMLPQATVSPVRANRDLSLMTQKLLDFRPPIASSLAEPLAPEAHSIPHEPGAWKTLPTSEQGIYCSRCRQNWAYRSGRLGAYCANCGIIWLME